MADGAGAEAACASGDRHLPIEDPSLKEGKTCIRCGQVLLRDPVTGAPFVRYESHSIDDELPGQSTGLANTPTHKLGSKVFLFSRRDFRVGASSERSREDLARLRHNMLVTERMDKARATSLWLEEGRVRLTNFAKGIKLDINIVQDAMRLARAFREAPRTVVLPSDSVFAACLSLACYQHTPRIWFTVDALFPLLGIHTDDESKELSKPKRKKLLAAQRDARRRFYLARKKVSKMLGISYDPFGDGQGIIQFYTQRSELGPKARASMMRCWKMLMERSQQFKDTNLRILPEDLREAEAARALFILALRSETGVGHEERLAAKRMLGVTGRTETDIVRRVTKALGPDMIREAFPSPAHHTAAVRP